MMVQRVDFERNLKIISPATVFTVFWTVFNINILESILFAANFGKKTPTTI